MTEFEKRILLNKYIKTQEKYCREQDLLTTSDKIKLERICKRSPDKEHSEFFNLITDELSAYRYKNVVSYLYNYRQAQALAYCCKKLNKKIEIEVLVDGTDADYSNGKISDVELKYIRFTYLGKENNYDDKKTKK